ncbi:MAG: acyl-CoA dehydrogenase family protein [Nocardioidaceae bacterium]
MRRSAPASVEFAEAEVAPHAAEWDRKHHFPVDVVRKMGALGLFGLTAPEEFGGAGDDGDFTSLCVAIEEIGRVDQSMGITLEAAVGLGVNPILTFGTDEQKQTWLPDLVAGDALAGLVSPNRAQVPTPGQRRPRRSSWTVSGASTGPSSSSPTPDLTSRRS